MQFTSLLLRHAYTLTSHSWCGDVAIRLCFQFLSLILSWGSHGDNYEQLHRRVVRRNSGVSENISPPSLRSKYIPDEEASGKLILYEILAAVSSNVAKLEES